MSDKPDLNDSSDGPRPSNRQSSRDTSDLTLQKHPPNASQDSRHQGAEVTLHSMNPTQKDLEIPFYEQWIRAGMAEAEEEERRNQSLGTGDNGFGTGDNGTASSQISRS